MNTIGRGFSTQGPEWVRGPARVTDGEVILDKNRADRYKIRQTEGLLLDLAGLDKDDPEQIVAFVRRYGLLRHGPDELKGENGELRESVRDWKRTGQEIVNTINFYIDLRTAEKEKSWQPLRNSASPLFSYFYKQCIAQEESEWWTYEDHVGLASQILAWWINEKLQGCELGVVAAVAQGIHPHHGHLLLTHHPQDLVTAAYAELAMLIVNQTELKECKGCGRIFPPETKKEKYHSKQCSTNTRQRESRRRRKRQVE